MIFNTTHTHKENENLITDIVGSCYTFLEALKIGGIGSKRMIIKDVSRSFKKIINEVSDINYANIELRKKGILIFINKGLQNFAWAIPYYQLHLYKTESFSIHAQGKYIQFKNNKTLKENKKFLDKLLEIKVNYDKQYEFQL